MGITGETFQLSNRAATIDPETLICHYKGVKLTKKELEVMLRGYQDAEKGEHVQVLFSVDWVAPE